MEAIISLPKSRNQLVGRGFGSAAELRLGACDLKYSGRTQACRQKNKTGQAQSLPR
jgi:hypothetical protein